MLQYDMRYIEFLMIKLIINMSRKDEEESTHTNVRYLSVNLTKDKLSYEYWTHLNFNNQLNK